MSPASAVRTGDWCGAGVTVSVTAHPSPGCPASATLVDMRERGLEWRVGLLILISSAILVGFIFVLGNFSLRSGYEISLDFDYVGSLRAGAPVKVSGIKVGKISDIEFHGGAVDAAL